MSNCTVYRCLSFSKSKTFVDLCLKHVMTWIECIVCLNVRDAIVISYLIYLYEIFQLIDWLAVSQVSFAHILKTWIIIGYDQTLNMLWWDLGWISFVIDSYYFDNGLIVWCHILNSCQINYILLLSELSEISALHYLSPDWHVTRRETNTVFELLKCFVRYINKYIHSGVHGGGVQGQPPPPLVGPRGQRDAFSAS